MPESRAEYWSPLEMYGHTFHQDCVLSANARAVIAALNTHTETRLQGKEKPPDPKRNGAAPNQAWCSLARLAKESGLSRGAVILALEELTKSQWVVIQERTIDGTKASWTHLYSLTPKKHPENSDEIRASRTEKRSKSRAEARAAREAEERRLAEVKAEAEAAQQRGAQQTPPSAQPAPPGAPREQVVHDMHEGGAPREPGVVHDVNRGGSPRVPDLYPGSVPSEVSQEVGSCSPDKRDEHPPTGVPAGAGLDALGLRALDEQLRGKPYQGNDYTPDHRRRSGAKLIDDCNGDRHEAERRLRQAYADGRAGRGGIVELAYPAYRLRTLDIELHKEATGESYGDSAECSSTHRLESAERLLKKWGGNILDAEKALRALYAEGRGGLVPNKKPGMGARALMQLDQQLSQQHGIHQHNLYNGEWQYDDELRTACVHTLIQALGGVEAAEARIREWHQSYPGAYLLPLLAASHGHRLSYVIASRCLRKFDEWAQWHKWGRLYNGNPASHVRDKQIDKLMEQHRGDIRAVREAITKAYNDGVDFPLEHLTRAQ